MTQTDEGNHGISVVMIMCVCITYRYRWSRGGCGLCNRGNSSALTGCGGGGGLRGGGGVCGVSLQIVSTLLSWRTRQEVMSLPGHMHLVPIAELPEHFQHCVSSHSELSEQLEAEVWSLFCATREHFKYNTAFQDI